MKQSLDKSSSPARSTLLTVLVLSLVFGIAADLRAGINSPGVYNTPHDVRVITGQEGLEPCAMCHTPHSGTGAYPLWNRDQGGQTYDLYSSPSFDMYSGNQPQSPSALCLVCHNGVFSSLVNYPGPSSPQNDDYDYEMNPSFWAMLGTDLSNDHPISFTYNPNMDNTQDNNGFPAPNICNTGTSTRYWIPSQDAPTGLAYPLYGTDRHQFECATCHSVHDTVQYNGKQLVGGKSVGTQVFFLRHSNAESKMCYDCHRNRYNGSW
jgi:hypothetical protein